LQALSDVKVWLGGVIFIWWVEEKLFSALCSRFSSGLEALYSIALFLPSIIKSLGFTGPQAQLLTVPVNFFAALYTIATGAISDRTGYRGPWVVFNSVLAVIGYALAFASNGAPALGYAGAAVAAAGSYASASVLPAWTASNAGGEVKRGIAIAMGIGCSSLGG